MKQARRLVAITLLWGACQVPNPAFRIGVGTESDALTTRDGAAIDGHSGGAGDAVVGAPRDDGGAIRDTFPVGVDTRMPMDTRRPTPDVKSAPDLAPAACPANPVYDWPWWTYEQNGLLRFPTGDVAQGVWGLVRDVGGGGSGSLSGLLIPGGRNGSVFGMRFRFVAAVGWGAGVHGNVSPTPTAVLDASGHRGLRLFARANAGGATTVTIRLVTRDTDTNFGICTTCKGHHEVTVPVDSNWNEYVLCFSRFMLPAGRVVPAPGGLDLRSVSGVEIVAPPGATERDIWLDDIELFR